MSVDVRRYLAASARFNPTIAGNELYCNCFARAEKSPHGRVTLRPSNIARALWRSGSSAPMETTTE
jgi:hypothetical protein